MKSKRKIFSLVAVMLATMALSACGSGTKTCADGKHKYVEDKTASVAATCTSEGKKVQKCEVCGDVKETVVKKTSHKYVVDATAANAKAATCTEPGVKVEKCSVCNDVKTTNIEALGHELGDVVATTPATCEEPGVGTQTCTREGCNHSVSDVVIPALGHELGEVVATKAAKCEEAGEGTQACTREGCNHVETVSIPATGHDIKLVGELTEPDVGFAMVRNYACTHDDCNVSYLGFQATEVTTESKSHLVFEGDEEKGARFWGRPIGNAVALDDNGTADSNDHTPVFDENEQGDFFEYKFVLTAAQAAGLSTCHLYCDAKPASYLRNSDFWACKEGAEEWTPGMYLEGEEKGQEIKDYRYVLYVDGERKNFDPEMACPVPQSEARDEYVLPYTFSLHEGTNTIRLVMAGGYRSLFYKFTFRAVTPAPAVEA